MTRDGGAWHERDKTCEATRTMLGCGFSWLRRLSKADCLAADYHHAGVIAIEAQLQ